MNKRDCEASLPNGTRCTKKFWSRKDWKECRACYKRIHGKARPISGRDKKVHTPRLKASKAAPLAVPKVEKKEAKHGSR